MTPRRWRSTWVLALLLAPLGAAAQDTTTGTAPRNVEPPPFCFQPAAAPACRGFMITELDVPIALHQSGADEATSSGAVFRPQIRRPVNATLGVMRNVSSTSAIGAAIFTGAPAEHRVGVVGRYRRWLGHGGAVDLSAGPMVAQVHGANLSNSERGRGATADVALTWYDWFGVSVRGEALRTREATATGLYVGVRAGSVPAVVISIVGGLGMLLILVAGSS